MQISMACRIVIVVVVARFRRRTPSARTRDFGALWLGEHCSHVLAQTLVAHAMCTIEHKRLTGVALALAQFAANRRVVDLDERGDVSRSRRFLRRRCWCRRRRTGRDSRAGNRRVVRAEYKYLKFSRKSTKYKKINRPLHNTHLRKRSCLMLRAASSNACSSPLLKNNKPSLTTPFSMASPLLGFKSNETSWPGVCSSFCFASFSKSIVCVESRRTLPIRRGLGRFQESKHLRRKEQSARLTDRR